MNCNCLRQRFTRWPVFTGTMARRTITTFNDSETKSPRRFGTADISSEPTNIVKVSRLPPTATPGDIRCIIATSALSKKMKALNFEYDRNLRPLHSCRAVFYEVPDAIEFSMRANSMKYSESVLRADFVQKPFLANPMVKKYLSGGFGRLVYLYGYPPYVNEHQIRDYYKEYDIVDTTIPGVQRAPQEGVSFLARRGAFFAHFATPSEARRFARDVYNTEYASRLLADETSNEEQHRYILKTILIH